MTISKKDKNKCKNSVQSAIRQSFARSEHYKGFLELHRIEWYVGKRKRVSYKCNCCESLFSSKDIQVDHVVPLGRFVYRGLKDAHRFYDLIYCDYSNLQILCKACHKVKTKEEQENPSFHNAIF